MGAKAHRPQTSLLTSGAATLLGQHTDKSPIDNMDAFNTLTETLPDQQPPSPSPVHQLSGDPWFQKHGVKGFLDWKLLWEDVPPEKFCLGSSFPGYFVQRSPRSEARSLAKIREFLDNPPERANTTARSEIRPNDRVSIFGPSPASKSRFNILEQNKQAVAQAWKTPVDSQKGDVGMETSRSHPQSDESEGVETRGIMKDEVDTTSPKLKDVEGSKSTSDATVAKDVKEPKPLGPDSVHRKEKMPLEVRKPGGPAATSRPLGLSQNPLHHRQSSSLNAAATPFRSQGSFTLTTTTSNQTPNPSDHGRASPYIPPHAQERRLSSAAQNPTQFPETTLPQGMSTSTPISTPAMPLVRLPYASNDNPTLQPMGSFAAHTARPRRFPPVPPSNLTTRFRGVHGSSPSPADRLRNYQRQRASQLRAEARSQTLAQQREGNAWSGRGGWDGRDRGRGGRAGSGRGRGRGGGGASASGM